jgi:membrane protease YdiL (CAAX protease family)
MTTQSLGKLFFPPSKLPNAFPWTVETAGKNYLAGLLRFIIGSFLVPLLFSGSILLLAYYPVLHNSYLDTPAALHASMLKVGLFITILSLVICALRLRHRELRCYTRSLLLSAPLCVILGSFSGWACIEALLAFEHVQEPLLNRVMWMLNGVDGQPNMTFIMVLSLISFVMGFGWQITYIAHQMRKSGVSLAKAMALTFEPLMGSWWGATAFNTLLPVAIAYGVSQLLGQFVVYCMGPAHQPTVELAQQATGNNFLLFALMAVLGAPLFEEIVFRGFLFQVIRCALLREQKPLQLATLPATGARRALRIMRNRLAALKHRIGAIIHRVFRGSRAELSAIVLSSLMFSLLHMQFQPTTLVMLFLVGCIQAEVYRRTGSLYCGMMLHALNNGIDVLKLALGQA